MGERQIVPAAGGAGLREPDPLTTAFNFFMNVEMTGEGRLVFAPPRPLAFEILGD